MSEEYVPTGHRIFRGGKHIEMEVISTARIAYLQMGEKPVRQARPRKLQMPTTLAISETWGI